MNDQQPPGTWAKIVQLAKSSAIVPKTSASTVVVVEESEPSKAEEPAKPGGGTPAPTGTTTTTKTTTTTDEGSAAGFPNWMLWIAMLLWAGACLAGTIGTSLQFLPHESFIVSATGEGIRFCSDINPNAVEADQSVARYWCTTDEVLGETLPADVRTVSGGVLWVEVGADDVAKAFGQPQLWLTLGLGLIALMFLTGFAKATGTLRAGLAASISVVFLGLLLFPTQFTNALPADMRSELIGAWQWVIAFYFGSEAAVQAFKVWKPAAAAVGGDVAPAPAKTTTTTL